MNAGATLERVPAGEQVSAGLDTPLTFPHPVLPACRAIAVIPARNEEDSLERTLTALNRQTALDGGPLPQTSFEVLLLLNNCTDRSAAVAEHFAQSHPDLPLRVRERTLPPGEAHVGTARRLLMDAACERLETLSADEDNGVRTPRAILSTDADTVVAPDWIARNLHAIAGGAEVVGGVIHLFPEELAALDPGTRAAYEADRRLQGLVAELEALLDPDPDDPCPRHLEHFGASLACTPGVYRRAGGLPAVTPLEDVAFIDELRKAGARIRHDPDVHITTSARLDGRAEVGLSGQLRIWARERRAGLPHQVESAAWLAHRFRSVAQLRRFHAGEGSQPEVPAHWAERLMTARAAGLSTPRFLEQLDSNGLIEETFTTLCRGAARHDEIGSTMRELEAQLTRLRPAPARRV